MQGKIKKIKPIKLGEGLDDIFKKKAKRSSKAHRAKGSTWLKKPPRYKSEKRSKKAGRLQAG